VQSFDARKYFTMEYRLRGRDGKYRRVADAGAPYFLAGGGFMGYAGAAVDISDIGIADGSVEESEARFRALFERNVVPLAFWNVDGRIVDANKAYLRLTGYTLGDLRRGTLGCAALTPAEYKDLDRVAISELRTGRAKVRAYEKEYVRRDGRRVPVLIAGALLPGYNDRGVVCALDLTRHKITEARLEDSRTLLNAVFNSLHGLVTVIDRTGHVIALKEPQTAISRRKKAVYADLKMGVNYLTVCKEAQITRCPGRGFGMEWDIRRTGWEDTRVCA